MNDSTGSVGYAGFRIQKYRNTVVPGEKEDRRGFILLHIPMDIRIASS
jgi:hypothetical protein